MNEVNYQEMSNEDLEKESNRLEDEKMVIHNKQTEIRRIIGLRLEDEQALKKMEGLSPREAKFIADRVKEKEEKDKENK